MKKFKFFFKNFIFSFFHLPKSKKNRFLVTFWPFFGHFLKKIKKRPKNRAKIGPKNDPKNQGFSSFS